MKAAIYCRVSTEEQTTENQTIRLIEYAKRSNWEYEVFEETESSRNTRPIKNALLNRLRQMEFDVLLIYKLDRWARSSTELVLEFTELHNKGINIVSISDNLDLSTSTGKLQFQILSAFAEFERNLISERTKEGLNRAKAQGKKIGRPKLLSVGFKCRKKDCHNEVEGYNRLCNYHKKKRRLEKGGCKSF